MIIDQSQYPKRWHQTIFVFLLVVPTFWRSMFDDGILLGKADTKGGFRQKSPYLKWSLNRRLSAQ